MIFSRSLRNFALLALAATALTTEGAYGLGLGVGGGGHVGVGAPSIGVSGGARVSGPVGIDAGTDSYVRSNGDSGVVNSNSSINTGVSSNGSATTTGTNTNIGLGTAADATAGVSTDCDARGVPLRAGVDCRNHTGVGARGHAALPDTRLDLRSNTSVGTPVIGGTATGALGIGTH